MQAITIKKIIDPIRKKMPRYGTEKLHLDIQNQLQENGIKMGRDNFLKFLQRASFISTQNQEKLYHH